MEFADILGHYWHQLIQFGFAATVAAVIVMVIHRVFQPVLLSMLDELRDTTKLFREILAQRQQPSDADKRLVGHLALAYAIISGAVFLGIITLISNLATPVG